MPKTSTNRIYLPPSVLLVSLLGCNALLGNEKRHLSTCTLDNECTDSKLCLLGRCSRPCTLDSDCAPGSRCLETDAGSGCVAATQSACLRDSDCPAGSECNGDQCRNSCIDNTDCVSDQRCRAGACTETDDSTVGREAGTDIGGGSGLGGSSSASCEGATWFYIAKPNSYVVSSYYDGCYAQEEIGVIRSDGTSFWASHDEETTIDIPYGTTETVSLDCCYLDYSGCFSTFTDTCQHGVEVVPCTCKQTNVPLVADVCNDWTGVDVECVWPDVLE